MVDYLKELPLPGRVFAPAAALANQERPTSASLGFIAGPENRLVASTVMRLIHFKPSPQSRLITLFGPSGSGKTHLAIGLVRHWNERHGADHALYLTAGDFYRQFVDAIKQRAIGDFRQSLRNHDLIAFDDLHQLPDVDHLAQELRFTLDACEANGATVLVTARHAPQTLPNLSADVRSRLASGMVLQLSLPGIAARERILQRASECLGHSISAESASLLAEEVRGTANDLFGVLFRHTSETVRDVDAIGSTKPARASSSVRKPALPEIIALVARYFCLPKSQLKSASRRQSIVAARAIVVFLARELAGATYEQIGRALGGRDHTTIMHNYRQIETRRLRDSALQHSISELRRMLQAR